MFILKLQLKNGKNRKNEFENSKVKNGDQNNSV
jgi:hypothetical protein